jgi:hypothetical protein
MSATLNKILDAFDQYEAMRLVGKGLEWKWSAEAEEKFLRLGREHQALMTMENIFKIAEEVTHTQTALLNNAKDILRYRHLGLAYLKMLHVSDPIAASIRMFAILVCLSISLLVPRLIRIRRMLNEHGTSHHRRRTQVHV